MWSGQKEREAEREFDSDTLAVGDGGGGPWAAVRESKRAQEGSEDPGDRRRSARCWSSLALFAAAPAASFCFEIELGRFLVHVRNLLGVRG